MHIQWAITFFTYCKHFGELGKFANRSLGRPGGRCSTAVVRPVLLRARCNLQCGALLRGHQWKIAAFCRLFCKTDFVEETDLPLPQIERIISSSSETAVTIADCCDGLALCSVRTLRSVSVESLLRLPYHRNKLLMAHPGRSASFCKLIPQLKNCERFMVPLTHFVSYNYINSK